MAGVEHLTAIIAMLEEHGAEYTGIQPGIGEISDMLIFRDLTTGTSLALPLAEVTRNSIYEKLVSARAKFGF